MSYNIKNQEPHFCKGDMFAALEGQQRGALSAVDQYDGNQLLNSSLEDLVSYFVERYKIAPITLDEEGIYADPQEAKIDVSNDSMARFFADRPGPILVDGLRVIFYIPYSGEKDLFKIRPSTFSTVFPYAIITGAEIVMVFESREADATKLRAEFDRQLDLLKKYISWQQGDVEGFNSRLPGLIRQQIEARRQRLLANQGVASALGFPLKKRETAHTYAVPTVRRKISIAPPPATSAPYAPEPTLSPSDYENILSFLDGLCRGLERSPSTYSQMGEEKIRDQFLVSLNATFEGRATGETFNKSGKTDILIREKNENVFVAECKFWGGEKKLIETIDQLLSYLTWRDTKTAVMIFNKNKNLTAVMDKIKETVPNHPNYKKKLEPHGDSNFRYLFGLPGDPNREIYVALMIFDVPAGE